MYADVSVEPMPDRTWASVRRSDVRVCAGATFPGFGGV